MAFSIQRAVSDGTMTLLPVSIEYFDREEISVLFDGVLNARQWAWVGTVDKTLSFTPAVDNAVEVMIVRSTDLAELRHQFSLGAQFTAESLDESLLQILHIAQEAKEGSNLGEIFQNLNFHGFKAINMGNGSDPGDAVNHAQMEVHDAIIAGYKDSAQASAVAAAASASSVASTNADLLALKSTSGSSLVGFLPSGTGATATTVQAKLRESISVHDFGAVGNGVADDTAAIQAAINSGKRICLGDSSCTYRITDSINSALTSNLVLESSGAVILFDPPTPKQYVISISVVGGSHKVSGHLTINANRNAYIGLYVVNNTDTEANIVLEDLVVSDVYRASTAFAGGDGIWIRGLWGNVHLERPDVRRVTMAAGVGTIGVQGVSGISITSSSTTPLRAPRKVTISDPYIEKVASEDLSYVADQDGIRVFAGEDVVGLNVPYESSFTVIGGTIKNCHGRSIKSQMEHGSVRGTKFVRTEGVAGGVGSAPEIDFQVGAGFVKDIECLYQGSVPSLIVGLSAPTQNTKTMCSGSVDGVKANVSGGVTLPSVVQNGPRSVTRQIVRMRDIEVIGALEKFIRFNGGNSGNFTLLMRDCVGAPTVAAVQAGSGTWGGDVFADGIINTGSAVTFLDLTSSNATPLMSVKNHVGFTTPKTMVGNVDSGPYERVTALTAYGATKGGFLRPVCFDLADGAQYQLPQNAVNVQSCMLLVSVGSSRNDQGIFACDSGAVIALAAGTGFSVGGTTEPASGNYRIWSGGTGGGPIISNRVGSTRTFTVWMLG